MLIFLISPRPPGTRDDAGPIAYDAKEENTSAEQLSLYFADVTRGKSRSGTLNFKPPVGFWFETLSETQKKGGLGLFCVPVEPGVTRLFIVFLHFPQAILDIFPAWFLHKASNDFLDTDTLLLQVQTRRIQQEAADGQMQAGVNSTAPIEYYHYGSPADRFVSLFWQWFHKHFNATIPYSKHIPSAPLMSRSEILDRGTQHVDTCLSCSQMRDRLNRAPYFLGAALLCASVWLRQRPFVVTIMTVATFLIGHWIRGLQRSFGFTDYVHANEKK